MNVEIPIQHLAAALPIPRLVVVKMTNPSLPRAPANLDLAYPLLTCLTVIAGNRHLAADEICQREEFQPRRLGRNCKNVNGSSVFPSVRVARSLYLTYLTYRAQWSL